MPNKKQQWLYRGQNDVRFLCTQVRFWSCFQVLLNGCKNRTLWRGVTPLGHHDACSYFEYNPDMVSTYVPLQFCTLYLPDFISGQTSMIHVQIYPIMSHEYIDVYCIIIDFFVVIGHVFVIICANIKSCNSTTKNPLRIAVKKSCQFSCDFLESTKEWMRRGLEALRSLFAHVELCLY